MTKQCASKTEPLSLAAGKYDPSLADHGIETVWKRLHENGGGAGERSVHLLLGRARCRPVEVESHRVVEEERVLRYVSDLTAPRFQPRLVENLVVDEHGAGIRSDQ